VQLASTDRAQRFDAGYSIRSPMWPKSHNETMTNDDWPAIRLRYVQYLERHLVVRDTLLGWTGLHP
jgi:hypothetical protein